MILTVPGSGFLSPKQLQPESVTLQLIGESVLWPPGYLHFKGGQLQLWGTTLVGGGRQSSGLHARSLQVILYRSFLPKGSLTTSIGEKGTEVPKASILRI